MNGWASVVSPEFIEEQPQIVRITTPELKDVRGPVRSKGQPVSCCLFQTQDTRAKSGSIYPLEHSGRWLFLKEKST